MQLRRYRLDLALLPALLILVLVACENPSITIINQTNQTGGTLQVTGSGFTPGNPVSVSINNVPGVGPWQENAGKADGIGHINVTITYSYAPGSQLPGCVTGSNSTVTLNADAIDSTSHVTAAAQVIVLNCGWATPQVTAHQ
jgi:hypothetical protein